MQQVTQQLKSGNLCIRDLPSPAVFAGQVLVRNHFSLISAGTEASTVKAARKSLIGKAKERPQQVRQVLEVLRAQGPVQTYRAVMKKLDGYSPLGYSSAGEVIEVGEDVEGFAVGDLVACAGATANHADVVSVPVNLCVKLAADADLKRASYNALGAIALQGIRQADLRLGESCAVIGLGLIGQLTCLMLRASGIKVVGIDVSPDAVQTSLDNRAVDFAWVRSSPGIVEQIEFQTGGLGVDGVIITAGTNSLDPINFAGSIARKKGRVVVVGAVPTGFDRDPHYYRKELELRMSCSYGPGRYDIEYEEKGRDYPAAYVRWTEKRNMQAFQELIYSQRIDIDYLTTHVVPLETSPAVYEMILNRSEPFLGVVIQYDTEKSITRERVQVRECSAVGTVGLGFIGAGGYAQGNLLPNLPKDSDIIRYGVLTNSGTTSKRVAERFGFEFAASSTDDILNNDQINTVFIATRHDSHASYVLSALASGKNVFVEKPLCLTVDELLEIKDCLGQFPTGKIPQLMVGYNRRFAPHAVELKKRLHDAPMSMFYRVNAGSIPSDSWIQDPDIGGGRIVGEACHFIDLLTWLCGSLPKTVQANAMDDADGTRDTVSINIAFENGSIGTICYFSNGAKGVPKEYLEVHQSGLSGILKDFKELEVHEKGKPHRAKSLSQNKGQANMVRAFLERVKSGGMPLIPPQEIFAVTLASLAALESIRNRASVEITHTLMAK
ncbi:MAG TPA: Gfo/Idh/MocA family oxidoreductase [Pirellulaceae bacterium]|nr:Gfo/Idh/MocA family oxidoreductase [Pirellulaceae bacterium]